MSKQSLLLFFMPKVAHQSGNKARTRSNPCLINGSNSLDPTHIPIRKARTVTSGNSPYFSDAESSLKSSPRTYLDSGTTTKHFRVKKKRRKASETLGIKRASKLKLVKFLGELKQANYADSMSKCGERWSAMMCGEHIASKIPFHRCNIRFCPVCANRRAARFVKKYLVFVAAFIRLNLSYKPCLLTLTQKKIKGESKKEARARILKSFKQVIRRKFFAEYFAGGIWAGEVTENESGNHFHLHLFVFRRKFIDAKLLKSEWAKVSPGAKNLNIKLIDSLENGLREVIKYISKPIPAENLTLQSVKEILELKGLRMIDTFGDFRKFCRDYEPPEDEESELEGSDKPDFVAGECCPHPSCGKPLFERILTDVELIAFHRRRERFAENQIRDKLREEIL
jgi:plasmid rolling circle replication initiator protein Rep